ncbi:MAG: hypothetical protein KAR85_03170 [Methanosarcinales archaeon]|nr:hypothetical protein [Methanosarcinales archaeon]
MDRLDINGRIESFDQNLRSLDRRLRAIERRLSGNTTESNLVLPEPESDQWKDIDVEKLNGEISTLQALQGEMHLELGTIKSKDLSQIHKSLSEMMHDIKATNDKIKALTKQQTNLKDQTAITVDSLSIENKSEIKNLQKELEKVNIKLKRQDNMNKITIGSVKVPVELSGIVASVALITTGYLVWVDQWQIIRSTYYPIGLAVLFAAAVTIKFVMSNRQPE